MFQDNVILAVPVGFPQGLAIASSNATSITISWDRVECLQRNSEITGYRVTYQSTPTSRQTRQLAEDVELANVTVDGTNTADRRFTAMRLLPRISYTLNVMAVNSESQIGPAATMSAITDVPEGLFH